MPPSTSASMAEAPPPVKEYQLSELSEEEAI
jgi:hypothetical protein